MSSGYRLAAGRSPAGGRGLCAKSPVRRAARRAAASFIGVSTSPTGLSALSRGRKWSPRHAGVTAVQVAADCGEDRRLDGRPVVQNHRRVEAQRHEAERHRDGIAYEVLMSVLAAVRRAVGLEDQAVADDEVDDADPWDAYLARERQPMSAQPQADDRLETTVGVGASEVDQPTLVAIHRTA